jgi:hypothetical protein
VLKRQPNETPQERADRQRINYEHMSPHARRKADDARRMKAAERERKARAKAEKSGY